MAVGTGTDMELGVSMKSKCGIAGLNCLRRMVFAMLLAVTATAAFANTVFKCKGSDGLFHYQGSKCFQEQEISSWEATVPAVKTASVEKRELPSEAVVIQEGAFQSYRVRGYLNDIATTMLVDTGASFVAIPSGLADKLGLGCKSLVVVNTANGRTKNCRSTVKTLRIGNFVLPDIDVIVIAADSFAEVLLGQSALRRLKVEQESGEIRLTMPKK